LGTGRDDGRVANYNDCVWDGKARKRKGRKPPKLPDTGVIAPPDVKPPKGVKPKVPVVAPEAPVDGVQQ